MENGSMERIVLGNQEVCVRGDGVSTRKRVVRPSGNADEKRNRPAAEFPPGNLNFFWQNAVAGGMAT
jgi:hypothetical protein